MNMENFKTHNQTDAQHQAYVWPDHLSTHTQAKHAQRESTNFEACVANIHWNAGQKRLHHPLFHFLFHLHLKLCSFNLRLLLLPLLFHSVLIRWFNTLRESFLFWRLKIHVNRTGCHCFEFRSLIHSIIPNAFSKHFSRSYSLFRGIMVHIFCNSSSMKKAFLNWLFILTKEMERKKKKHTQHTAKWIYTIAMCMVSAMCVCFCCRCHCCYCWANQSFWCMKSRVTSKNASKQRTRLTRK